VNDKQILDEVYKMCCNPFERCDIKSFIEQEWQRADEIEAKLNKIEKKERTKKNEKNDHPLTKWDEGQQYFMDVGEMERHRGLEIGEDGTVKSLK